uniref:Ureide permease n=1 Tax=Opuntia streptacantha TaxID=393608 RepID=A0A7C9DFP2_OPUST
MAKKGTMLFNGELERELVMGNPDLGNLILDVGLKVYEIQSTGGAIGCMLVSLFFLGTWPAIIASLERRGRLPQHTALDYAISNLLAAVIMVVTIGQNGDSKPALPNFLDQLSQIQENWPSVSLALTSGVILSMGNLSAQYSWALVGLSVTEVVSCSISVTIGTTMNYFLDSRMNKAEILFPGVGCFLIAVFLGSAVHKSNAADNIQKLRSLPTKLDKGARNKDVSTLKGISTTIVEPLDAEKGNKIDWKREPEPEFGSVDFLIELEQKRSIKVFGRGTWVGLTATFFAGFCFALFSPLFNLASNDQFHLLKRGVPHLVVYTGFFYFSVSFTVIAVILNVSFLYHPILGAPKSSFSVYLKDWNGRAWAILAGLLCGFGNGLRFMGGQAAGYATADSVQALPLVTTLWGVLIFGEYRKSSRQTYILLTSMLSMFTIAVGFFLGSSQHRKL